MCVERYPEGREWGRAEEGELDEKFISTQTPVSQFARERYRLGGQLIVYRDSRERGRCGDVVVFAIVS